MANNQGYNGWTNYETWAVNLWIGNEQYMESHAQELTNQADDTYELAGNLKEWIEEENPLSGQASLYSDLLNAAISEVNWQEIAEHYWEDYRDEEEDEEE